MTRLSGSGPRRQRSGGSAFVETLIALPLMYLIGGGVVQWEFIYEAKSTLNYATFMAARSGTVNRAQEAPMRRAFARSLVPLYSPEKSIAGLTRTLAETTADAFNPTITRLRILNPTSEAFDDFGQDLDEDGAEDDLRNSRLWQASTQVGSSSGVNIQDANLLKLEVVYRYELKVPYVGAIIAAVADAFTADEDWTVESAGRLQGRRDNTPRIPILATATVRMQSEAERNNLMVSREDLDDAFESEPSVAGPVEIPPEPPRPRTPTPGDGGEVNFIADDPPLLAGGGGGDGRTDLDDTEGEGIPACSAEGDDQSEPASQSTGLPSQSGGNPINIVTGNKYQREVDLGPLPGELGLAFVRHYNSRGRQDSVTGFGWRHSYAARLTPPSERGAPIRLTQADGRKLLFQSDDGRHYRARLSGDGTLAIIRRDLRDEYHWRWRNGRTLAFDQHGRLTGIKSPAAEAGVRLHYDADGRLWGVFDPHGRHLSLSYYPRGRLKAIFGPEQGRKTAYRYDDAGNLSEVTYPDGATRRYHYEDPNDTHNLTGITNRRGVRYATWAYNEHDRAILSTHANDAGKVSLDFGTPGRTLVTDGRGRESIYHTEVKDGVPLVTGIDGPGCSAGGRGDVSYRYNARYQLTEKTTKQGFTTRYDYDEQGRAVEVSAQYQQRPAISFIRYDYEGDNYRPARVSILSGMPKYNQQFAIRYDEYNRPVQALEIGFIKVQQLREFVPLPAPSEPDPFTIVASQEPVVSPADLERMVAEPGDTCENDPCAEEQAQVQALIDNLEPGDPVGGFTRILGCVTENSCAIKDQLDNSEWLDDVVVAFNDPFISREGEWPEIYRQCRENTVVSDLRCERAMAEYHIRTDLQHAVNTHGCGSREDWARIGQIVQDCVDEERDVLGPADRVLGFVTFDRLGNQIARHRADVHRNCIYYREARRLPIATNNSENNSGESNAN